MSKKEQTILEKAARLYAIPHYMRDVDVNFLDEYPYDSVAENAFIAGAEWQKSQMLKDAVEGYVGMHLTDKGTKVTVNSGYLPEEMGIRSDSKVRIIIVKAEEE